MEVVVVKSNKNKEKLVIDGYCYHLERSTAKVFSWCCDGRKKFPCTGRVQTNLIAEKHVVSKGPTTHSHDPMAYEKNVMLANASVKEMALTAAQPSQIIRDAIVECEGPCRVYLPSKNAQKSKIARVRSSNTKEPATLNEIAIPNNRRYLEGELFVLKESSYDGEKNILMGTRTSFKLLSEAKCWLMDGTFHVVPSIMTQLFSIHGYIDGSVVPLVFCLMSRKTKSAYRQFFQDLILQAAEFEVELEPDVIISDFEQAISSAAEELLTANFKGCLFHFGQNIWRAVQRLKFATKYARDETFAVQIRMLKSLAFVPAEEVPAYFTALWDYLTDPDAKAVAIWFKEVYVAGKTPASKPLYDPTFWSVESNLLLQFPSTQNNVEGWHRRLKVIVGKAHAGLYRLIGDLGHELTVAKLEIEKLRSGMPGAGRNTNRQKQKQRILSVIQRRDSLQKTEFLKCIANNIRLS